MEFQLYLLKFLLFRPAYREKTDFLKKPFTCYSPGSVVEPVKIFELTNQTYFFEKRNTKESKKTWVGIV